MSGINDIGTVVIAILFKSVNIRCQTFGNTHKGLDISSIVWEFRELVIP